MDMDFEVSRYAQDKHPSSHMHEQYEIFISLSDGGTFFVREEGYPLRFGLVFFLNPFEIHRCFCNGSREYDRYVVRFPVDYLKWMSTKNTDIVTLFNSAPIVQQLDNDTIFKMVEKLSVLSEPANDRFGNDCERNIALQNFLLLMARIINDTKIIANPAQKLEGRIGDILSYIHENYNQNLSLEELSKQFFISKSRLSAIFKETTGFSVTDYVITYRIKVACTLLQNGMNVQDVGSTVGFSTNTHFIRTFKNKIGCSPGSFAKRQSRSAGKIFDVG